MPYSFILSKLYMDILHAQFLVRKKSNPQTWILACYSAKHQALNMHLNGRRHKLSSCWPISQPSTVETESEEYCSHNNTESDIELQEKGQVIIEDVNTVRSMEMHSVDKNYICGDETCPITWLLNFIFYRVTHPRSLKSLALLNVS